MIILCPFCKTQLINLKITSPYCVYMCENHSIKVKLFTYDEELISAQIGAELYIQYYFKSNLAYFYDYDHPAIHQQRIIGLTPENTTYWLDRIFNLKIFL